MAISSLTKLTVPLANDSNANAQGLLMPKLQYRFRVTLENFGISGETQELTKQVIDASRPNVQFEQITLDVYNSRMYMAGKHTWNPITINLRDDINGNVQKLVGEQLQKQFDFMEQASAPTGQDYKFVSRIEVLDGGNGAYEVGVLETWELYGCYLTQVNYGQMAYGTNDPMQVELNIQYDNAVQLTQGVGVGTQNNGGTQTTGGAGNRA